MKVLYKHWKAVEKVNLIYVDRKWEISIKWKGEDCFFGEGWNDFALHSEIETGDTLVIFNLPTSEPHTYSVCIFKGKEKICDEDIGICNCT